MGWGWAKSEVGAGAGEWPPQGLWGGTELLGIFSIPSESAQAGPEPLPTQARDSTPPRLSFSTWNMGPELNLFCP